jgi:glycosyltransferase involved in cell wall biosynthesis
MKQLAISIVMPLYNKEAGVKRAIKSVLNQTTSNFELVVVNDGSTDKGPYIIRSINDSRIRVINQDKAGVSAARNQGIREAQSDLIAFLDADDEWKPSFLETIINLKNNFPSCNVFATNYIYCEASGALRLPIIRGLPPHPWEGILDDYFGIAVKSDPPIWTSAVAVRRGAIQSIGMFPVGVTSGEDLVTWAKLTVYNNIAYSTKHRAIFWIADLGVGFPSRIPDNDDSVGRSLEELLKDIEPHRVDNLKRYISLWYRMRAAQYLQIKSYTQAHKELLKSARFSKLSFQLFLYFAIASLPEVISSWLFKELNSLGRYRRKVFHNNTIN